MRIGTVNINHAVQLKHLEQEGRHWGLEGHMHSTEHVGEKPISSTTEYQPVKEEEHSIHTKALSLGRFTHRVHKIM